MVQTIEPQRKPTKLIVVAAFDEDEEGTLQPAPGYPAEQMSEERAVRTARALAGKHKGVIAWSRDADPAIGEYGPPKLLFTAGNVPEMD